MEKLVMKNIPQNEYRADPRLSASDCKMLIDAPYNFKMGIKLKKSKSMELGSVVHSLILEPDNFERDFLVMPAGLNLRTKAGKEAAAKLEEQAQQEGREIVSYETEQKAKEIVEKFRETEVGKLFNFGLAEHSFFGEVFGEPCKCRPDFYIKKDGLILDLKTAAHGTGSPSEFVKKIVNYSYHIQARFYLELLGAKTFIFVVVETDAPYSVGCYALDQDALDKGERLIRQAFDNYHNLDKFDRIYGSESGEILQELSLPYYALT